MSINDDNDDDICEYHRSHIFLETTHVSQENCTILFLQQPRTAFQLLCSMDPPVTPNCTFGKNSHKRFVRNRVHRLSRAHAHTHSLSRTRTTPQQNASGGQSLVEA